MVTIIFSAEGMLGDALTSPDVGGRISQQGYVAGCPQRLLSREIKPFDPEFTPLTSMSWRLRVGIWPSSLLRHCPAIHVGIHVHNC